MKLVVEFLNQEFKAKKKLVDRHIEQLAKSYQLAIDEAYSAAKRTNLRRWFVSKVQSFSVYSCDYQEWVNTGKLLFTLQSNRRQIHHVSDFSSKKRLKDYFYVKGFIPNYIQDDYERWYHLLQLNEYKAQLESSDVTIPDSVFVEHYQTFLPDNYQNYIDLKPLVFTPYLTRVLLFLESFSAKAFLSAWITNGFWLIETRYGLISISQLYKCFDHLHSPIYLTGLEFSCFLKGLLNSPPFAILASQGFSTPFVNSSYWLHFLGESGWTSLSQVMTTDHLDLCQSEPIRSLGIFDFQEFEMSGYKTRFRIQKPLEKPLAVFPQWEIWEFADKSVGLLCSDFQGLVVYPPVEQDSDKGAGWPLFRMDLEEDIQLNEIE